MKVKGIDIMTAPIRLDTGSGYSHGQVLFANDSRLVETYYDEPLTSYIQGWRDPNNLEETLEFLAPVVPVGRRFTWKKAKNAEEFVSELFDDQRAIGSDFKQVEYTGEEQQAKTINKGLTLIVDEDEVAAGWEQLKSAKLTRRLLRNEVRRAFNALDAAGTNENKVWGNAANPDQDVKRALLAATDVTGLRPNRVVYGDSAFQLRSESYEVQDNAGAYAAAFMDEVALARRLMVDRVYVSKERYQSSASAKTKVAGDKVLAFFAEQGVDEEDPANIKRFVSAVPGGGFRRVYLQRISAKLWALTVEHYSIIIVTHAGGVRKLSVSAA